jgi:hypothetical protein
MTHSYKNHDFCANFLLESCLSEDYGWKEGTRCRCLEKIKIEEKLLTHKFVNIFSAPTFSPEKKKPAGGAHAED